MSSRPTIAALTALLAVVSTSVGAAPPVASQEPSGCFTDWSDAAPVVVAHNLTPAKGLQDLARRHVAGEVLRITLCREDTRYVYRLLVRQFGGHISNVTVDAERPFAP